MKLAQRWFALMGAAAMLTAMGLTSATPALAAIVPDSTIHITLGGSELCLNYSTISILDDLTAATA